MVPDLGVHFRQFELQELFAGIHSSKEQNYVSFANPSKWREFQYNFTIILGFNAHGFVVEAGALRVPSTECLDCYTKICFESCAIRQTHTRQCSTQSGIFKPRNRNSGRVFCYIPAKEDFRLGWKLLQRRLNLALPASGACAGLLSTLV
ncbi:hypothetical protein TcWFU_003210 [Taenia crassiceps]|uniref:Uncharacterized protein n=1 Tax=Taenia crassiceps TaxID=6207 RepID=A0ABR4QKH4_9CEST